MSEPRTHDDGYEDGHASGYRQANAAMLGHLARELPRGTTEQRLAALLAERTATIVKLRELCARLGDNDWRDDLHLVDVLEKHLERHLDAKTGEER